jgi:hypothetical protein
VTDLQILAITIACVLALVGYLALCDWVRE